MNVYKFDEERSRREQAEKQKPPRGPSGPPAFNLPDVIVWTGGILIAVHLLRTFILPGGWDQMIIRYFAFWPVKYTILPSLSAPDLISSLWAFVTYSLLHGGAMHIIFNLLWMAIFGSAVARSSVWGGSFCFRRFVRSVAPWPILQRTGVNRFQ